MKRILSMGLALLMACLQASANDLKVWLSNPTMVADGKTVTYLTVFQTDAEQLYWSFELHVKLPKGLRIAQRKEGREMVDDVTLNPIRFDHLPHTIGVTIVRDTLNVVCMNTSNDKLYYRDDEDGNIIPELFTVGLVADPGMQNGKYELEMTVAKFGRLDFRNTLVSPAKAVMTVTGGQAAEGEVQYTLSQAGYGTLILPYEAGLPDGLRAFTCTRVEDSKAVLEEQPSIAANTPVILHGKPGTYTFAGEGTATEKAYTHGLLTGVYEDTEVGSGYVMQQQGGVLGFYAIGADSPRVVPANRCYLSAPSDARRIGLWLGDGVGLEEVAGQGACEAVIYDLAGRRVESRVKGIIIKNRKKVVQ